MTDEKLAEESLISYRKEPKWTGKIFMQDENTCYKDGFLAGLKAGRPKWHKVADGDLPKEDRYYLIYTDRGNYYVSKHHCNTNYWIGIQNQYVSIKSVIAWCEIPKYIEE